MVHGHQGWTGNLAYRAFSRRADSPQGPMLLDIFIFYFSKRLAHNLEGVVHWAIFNLDSGLNQSGYSAKVAPPLPRAVSCNFC